MKNNINKGIKLALMTAVISGVSGFINKAALVQIPPLLHTTLKNSLVFLFLIGLVLIFSRAKNIKKISQIDAIRLVLVGIVGGSLPFYLYFTALAKMPVINAMLIHKTLIFWVAMMAVPILGEKISRWHVVGIILLFASNLIIGGFEYFSFSIPELMILTATILWAIENIIAKKTLKHVDQFIVAGARMGIGSIILLAASVASGQTSLVPTLTIQQWAITALSAFILFGYVTTWYSALKYAPAITVASILVSSTIITNLLSAIFITHRLTFTESSQIFIIISGIAFIIFATIKSYQRRIDPSGV